MNEQELHAMMDEYKKEVQEEYEELLSKIQSGNAAAEDYISVVGYLEILDKKADKQEIDNYLETGARMAQRQLSSSDMTERITAYVTLAEYYKHKKNYKEALKCYDSAIDAGGKEYLVLRAQLRVQHLNDKKGAKKDYDIAVQSGLSEDELKMFNILVLNEKTLWEKIIAWAIMIFIITSVIVLLNLI